MDTRRPLYLDYNATTPLDPRVFDAMRPYFIDEPGNAGSRTHLYGQRAKEAVDRAREQVAALLSDAKPQEVVFTSGATESNNAVLLGLIRHGLETKRTHVLASAIEHKSVLEPLDRMREAGFEVELLPVTAGGYVEPDAVKSRLRPNTLLVSVMHANNETGVLQPVLDIADLLAGGPLFHVDAAQTYGKEVDALKKLRCDFLSLSGHKIYGPKGIGALHVRRRGLGKRPLTPLLCGGGQEMGLRPGTLPVPLAVGLGAAADLAAREHRERHAAAAQVKHRFLSALAAVDYHTNGDPARTQPHVVNISFPGVDSEALMMAVRNELAFSNGAACTSASYSPSHVLKAMGLSEERIATAVRISWGSGVKEIPAKIVVNSVKLLRES